jgi:predicted TIM-barrel fold metal-dependent hydrolase
MIIDTSNTLPTREMLFADLFGMVPGMEGYVKLFGAKWANWLGMTPEEFDEVTDRLTGEVLKEELIRRAENGPLRLDRFVATLRENGITWSAVHNMDEASSAEGAVPNEYVADILKKYPDQFIAFAGYNPHRPAQSLAHVERAVTELGFKAVVFRPFVHRCFADDRRYYPLYHFCEKRGIPVWIHTSVNWMTNVSIYYGHPQHLEPVLIDFPRLKIIAGHGGWPWIPDMVLMLWKYENLYTDTSAHRPKYLNTPNTGWDMFMKYANSTIQDKICFGSDWLSMGMHIRDILREIDEWPLKDSVKEKFFYKNAARIFNLEP